MLRLGRKMIFRWLSALILIGVQICAGASGYAYAETRLGIDEKIETTEGWAIGYNKTLNGCLASESFSDATTIWLGIDGRDHTFFLALTNPNWQSIEPGKQYLLRFLALGGGRWQGKFVGVGSEGGKGVISGGLKEKFVGDIVGSSGLAVSLGDKVVARLSLQGSAAAMSSVVHCQDDRGGGPPNGSPDSKRASTGTGFFITGSGHILTNAHVVKSCATVGVQQPGDVVHSGRVIAADRQNDLAVISTEMKPPAVAAIRTDVRLGENIAVFGFPLSDRLSTSGNFTVGYVSALAGYNDNSANIQISAPIQPGNSGGPVFDHHGNVVAVIFATATTAITTTSDEKPSVMPQNINFAIKSAIALAFLNSNGVTPDAPAVDNNKRLDSAELADFAKARTVKIACTR